MFDMRGLVAVDRAVAEIALGVAGFQDPAAVSRTVPRRQTSPGCKGVRASGCAHKYVTRCAPKGIARGGRSARGIASRERDGSGSGEGKSVANPENADVRREIGRAHV